jgi:hypothetical protein
MFVSSMSLVPLRGSDVLIWTGTISVVEIQLTRTICIGWALPIAPAGIVSVTWVPVAGTPLITDVPRLVVVTLGRAGGVGLAGAVVLVPVHFGKGD